MSDSELESKRLSTLLRHINGVKENCELLGLRLIERGEEKLGYQLIANGFVHDHSKFSGVEWLYLHSDIKESEPEKFELAVINHININFHHPEAWSNIRDMAPVYLAECICDLKARSSEFGNDLKEWWKEKWLPKYEVTTNCKIYKEMKDFLDLLLDKSFN